MAVLARPNLGRHAGPGIGNRDHCVAAGTNSGEGISAAVSSCGRGFQTTIDVDRNGKMTGVNYVTDGVEYFQPAKVVLVASFTYENTRLLLLSKTGRVLVIAT